MSQQSTVSTSETLPSPVRVHIVGAGPVGLLLAALLQSSDRFSVKLYEKRPTYTRTRMVQLAPYLVADSVESYSTDHTDEENIQAIFDPAEINEGLAFRQSIAPDLMALLKEWVQGFCPLNAIEKGLSDLIEARQSHPVERTTAGVTAQEAMAMLGPGDVLIDCTGCKSLLRDHLAPGAGGVEDANTFKVRMEYALVVTFLYNQAYDCNEYCKYYKNIETPFYKFIPAVNRTCYDGAVTHVTGIVSITAEDYERLPPRCDGQWLRTNFPDVAMSMDRFIAKVKQETQGELASDLELIRIPLDLYRARNATSRGLRHAGNGDQPLARTPVFLLGDSAVGSPYFQSISLGFECAMFLAGLLATHDITVRDLLDRYEMYTYKQWLRVYMRTKMIKHNKDVFQSLGDTFSVLEKLHIY